MNVGVVDSTLAAESEYAKYSFLGCSWAELEACKLWIQSLWATPDALSIL